MGIVRSACAPTTCWIRGWVKDRQDRQTGGRAGGQTVTV
jgi:hypothetical protein